SLFSSTISTNHACNQSERSSLLSLALNLSSPTLNWNSDNCCSWKASLGSKEVSFLFPLVLSHNSLYGSLEIGFLLSLNRLEILDLSYNLLSEELPFSLPSSSNIQVVDLPSNCFHATIPSPDLSRPLCLHSSSFIRVLDFSLNKCSGKISPELGECSKLQVFHAGYNNLSGELPDDTYNATTLQEIALPMNSLN
ncbi:hypothetical protein Prudu_021198, partial [Prunus dulcis]